MWKKIWHWIWAFWNTYCIEGLPDRDALNVNDKGRYPCDVCERSYAHKSDMLKHLDWKHRPVKPFSCEECDKNFYNQYSLRRHKQKMHGSHGATFASTSQSGTWSLFYDSVHYFFMSDEYKHQLYYCFVYIAYSQTHPSLYISSHYSSSLTDKW